MGRIVDELSRRRVFRATAWYVAVVLAGWQAADYVIAALALPQWLMRYAVILAMAGLPLVVVVSWMIDGRTALHQSMALPERRRRSLIILAGVCFALLVATALVRVVTQRADAAPQRLVEAVSLEMGIESYFSGDLDRAARILGAFGADSTQSINRRQEALRYRARALSELGEAAGSGAALENLVELEPPLALMLPGVETDTLMALYYRARRAKLARRGIAAQPSPVTAIEVLPFVTSGRPPSDAADAWDDFASAVPVLLMNDLFHRLKDVKFVDRSALSRHKYDTYRFLDSPDAAGFTRPSHLIIGSVAGAREQMLISAWMIDATNGTVAHSAQVLVPSAHLTLDQIRLLGGGLAGQIERTQMFTDRR